MNKALQRTTCAKGAGASQNWDDFDLGIEVQQIKAAKEKRFVIEAIALTVLEGFIILLAATSLAVAGLVLAQRRLPLEFRKAHNDTMGIIYGALHIVFGLIIGFTAFLVLDKFTTAQNTVASEAGDLVEIHRTAEAFAQTQRDQIQQLAKSYAQDVVDEEWPLMNEGQSSSRAEVLVDELGRSLQEFEPSTEVEKAAYSQELSNVHDLARDRNVRLLQVYTGLPPLLWAVLGVLAIVIIVFTYFLGMEDARLHRWAVGVLTASMVFTIVMILVLDHPFGAGFRVGPGAFERGLSTMEEATHQQQP